MENSFEAERFERIFKEKGPERWLLVDSFIKFVDPPSLISIAYEQFRKYGNERRMILCADILEKYGSWALDVLKRMSYTNNHECVYFIDTLINLYQNPLLSNEVSKVLLLWTKHSSRRVRLRLVESTYALPLRLRTDVLNILSMDYDIEVSTNAKYALMNGGDI